MVSSELFKQDTRAKISEGCFVSDAPPAISRPYLIIERNSWKIRNNTDVSISVILVNAIIFSVISLLREDPLSPGILDIFFFEISYHVSLLVSEFMYLKISTNLQLRQPNRSDLRR
jgi:hypothetical protein